MFTAGLLNGEGRITAQCSYAVPPQIRILNGVGAGEISCPGISGRTGPGCLYSYNFFLFGNRRLKISVLIKAVRTDTYVSENHGIRGYTPYMLL